MNKACWTAIVIMVTLFFSSLSRAGDAWESYKSLFLMPDGRIVDTANSRVSHSEGQGFAMLMAVANNDRDTFDKLWQWTQKTLQNKSTHLFYWRYDPSADNPVADKNNATDGDALIAWALIKADARWKNRLYGQEADRITRSLLKDMVIDYAGYTLMLPGKEGFRHEGEVVLNPSYFIFPAWQSFAKRSHAKTWHKLSKDARRLLSGMDKQPVNLPPDWVSLKADGQLLPAKGWPPRMSYDAIRVPLYLYWSDKNASLLQPWRAWFSHFSRAETPAWVNVVSNEYAPYMMSGGLLAVRDLVMGTGLKEPELAPDEGYYSASLEMLSWQAFQSQR